MKVKYMKIKKNKQSVFQEKDDPLAKASVSGPTHVGCIHVAKKQVTKIKTKQ